MTYLTSTFSGPGLQSGIGSDSLCLIFLSTLKRNREKTNTRKRSPKGEAKLTHKESIEEAVAVEISLASAKEKPEDQEMSALVREIKVDPVNFKFDTNTEMDILADIFSFIPGDVSEVLEDSKSAKTNTEPSQKTIVDYWDKLISVLPIDKEKKDEIYDYYEAIKLATKGVTAADILAYKIPSGSKIPVAPKTEEAQSKKDSLLELRNVADNVRKTLTKVDVDGKPNAVDFFSAVSNIFSDAGSNPATYSLFENPQEQPEVPRLSISRSKKLWNP